MAVQIRRRCCRTGDRRCRPNPAEPAISGSVRRTRPVHAIHLIVEQFAGVAQRNRPLQLRAHAAAGNQSIHRQRIIRESCSAIPRRARYKFRAAATGRRRRTSRNRSSHNPIARSSNRSWWWNRCHGSRRRCWPFCNVVSKPASNKMLSPPRYRKMGAKSASTNAPCCPDALTY